MSKKSKLSAKIKYRDYFRDSECYENFFHFLCLKHLWKKKENNSDQIPIH